MTSILHVKKRAPVLAVAVLALVMTLPASAQTTITGRVTAQDSGAPLPNTHIQVKHMQVGTVTDADGSYVLTVDGLPPIVLRFSYVGFRTEERTIRTPDDPVDVALRVQPLGSGTVVVTAQLREQELQDVPASVTVLEAETIGRTLQLNRVGDATRFSPGVSGKVVGMRYTPITIRGIGTSSYAVGSETSVGVFVDDVYMGRYTHTPALVDVERIEILKGPQGTLLGRNAAAGAIRVISNRPRNRREIKATVGVGSFGTREANYALNVPLSEKWSVRFAGRLHYRDGVRTITNHDNSQAGNAGTIAHRGSVLFRPDDVSSWLLSMHYYVEDEGALPFYNINTDLGVSGDPFDREVELNEPGYEIVKDFAARLEMNRILSDHILLKSITALRNVDTDGVFDADGSNTLIMAFRGFNPGDYASQEIRVQGTASRTEWLAAGSYFFERATGRVTGTYNDFFFVGGRAIEEDALGFDHPAFDVCDATSTMLLGPCMETYEEQSRSENTTNSFAVYGDLSHALSEGANVTVGVRLSVDRKRLETALPPATGVTARILGRNVLGPDTGDGVVIDEKTWTGLQPRLAVDFSLTQDLMAYASYSRGYKAGGFNTLTASRFEAETSNAYEVGLKGDFAEDRFRLNIAGYLTDYQDLQVLNIVNSRWELDNAARVVSRGIEVEASGNVTPALTLLANASLGRARYRDYVVPALNLDFSDNVPDRSPDRTYALMALYRKPLNGATLVARVEYAWQDRIFFDRFNVDERSQEAYGLLDAQVGVEGLLDGRLSITAYGSNLTDEDYVLWATNLIGVGTQVVPSVPRILGIRLGIEL